MRYKADRSLNLLRLGVRRSDATFREGQEEAIRHIIEEPGRLLLVQKTGWGKSFVYFIATKLLREAGFGPALLISPLLALMRNQIAAANRMEVRAETINSDNTDEWEEITRATLGDNVDILLISPERLANEKFRTEVLAEIGNRLSLLVIDEAHCISDWGHDFRPHYRLIERITRDLPANLRLLATTATANDRVMQDLETALGPDLNISRGDLGRPSLMLQTIHMPSQTERLAWLAEHVPEFSGHGIIYTLTVRDANLVAEWLRSRGINVEAYTANTGKRRPALEQALLDNQVKALVATTALGMGFDKPDLAFVIHFQSPGSAVAYYQQVGRAGRALDSAYGVLLSGEEENRIMDYFIESAFPTPDEVQQVFDALNEAPEGLSLSQLQGKVNISRGRTEKTLQLLSLEAPPPIVKAGSIWQLTAATLGNSFWERVKRLTELRWEEQAQMQEYVGLTSGHMEFLIRALDGSPNQSAPLELVPLPTAPNPRLVEEASAFLRHISRPIEPRKQWPTGGLPHYHLTGRIPDNLQAQPGKALCIWEDSGWGDSVRRGKYQDTYFSNKLVDACIELVRDWDPRPAPQWVTCIPSRRHPHLVPNFAQRLAAALKLPFKPLLIKTKDGSEQKLMENSVQQARNVDGSFELTERPPSEPVLLVDDMVDSRWTFTVTTWLLRSQGSGEVWPLALAQTGGG